MLLEYLPHIKVLEISDFRLLGLDVCARISILIHILRKACNYNIASEID
jgi:hypothetical protein